jgi:S1-C subfamily serine protease
VHNLAVLKYDPAALGGYRPRAATLSEAPLAEGDAVWQVGLGARQQLVTHKSTVRRLAPVLLDLPTPPFFRQTNLDAVQLEDAGEAVGGVLTDLQGNVRALWASFVQDAGEQPTAYFAGLPVSAVAPTLAALRAGRAPEARSLAAELTPIGLDEARDRGLGAASLAALAAGPRREALEVARLVAGTEAERVLREGDVLVSIAGQPATSAAVVDAAVLASTAPLLPARVLRDGVEQDVQLPVVTLPGDGVDRALLWAGALLHTPHAPIAAQRGVAPEGVYVAWSWYGAPAPRYGLRPTWRILAVDDTPVPTLDAFAQAVAGKKHGDAVRLRTVDLDGKERVITLSLDLAYWPTAELVKGPQGWERRPLGPTRLAEAP